MTKSNWTKAKSIQHAQVGVGAQRLEEGGGCAVLGAEAVTGCRVREACAALVPASSEREGAASAIGLVTVTPLPWLTPAVLDRLGVGVAPCLRDSVSALEFRSMGGAVPPALLAGVFDRAGLALPLPFAPVGTLVTEA